MEPFGNMKNKLVAVLLLAVVIGFSACNSNQSGASVVKVKDTTQSADNRVVPDFNADSAYAFTQRQVDFGPRVPGTAAHAKCADYLVSKLKAYHLETMVQHGTVKTFDGKQFDLKNIIGSYNPSATKRILLTSHWDARPFADDDSVGRDKPIDAAIDGASGVSVALEVARNLAQAHPEVGVDIVFFDLEDYGNESGMNTWCLGSQYWSQNPHKVGYSAEFGILLDMVGAPGAVFPKESNSVTYASTYVDKVWNAAAALGYSNYFSSENISFVGIDDHIPVNKAGIPCIDIIQYDKATQGFAPFHHTHKDNMSLVDRQTLKAVGQTLLEVITKEK